VKSIKSIKRDELESMNGNIIYVSENREMMKRFETISIEQVKELPRKKNMDEGTSTNILRMA